MQARNSAARLPMKYRTTNRLTTVCVELAKVKCRPVLPSLHVPGSPSFHFQRPTHKRTRCRRSLTETEVLEGLPNLPASILGSLWREAMTRKSERIALLPRDPTASNFVNLMILC